MHNYRIRPQKSPLWRTHGHAILSISVGQPHHEGAKLEAVINWVNQHFESCFVGVSDSLQRWNFLTDRDTSMAAAHAQANKAGEEWLKRNRKILDSLIIPRQIVRWDHWLQDPEFKPTRAAFQRLYETNSIFREAVDLDAAQFLGRRLGREDGVSIDQDLFLKNSRNFILEEGAGYTLLGRGYCSARIYPGKNLQSLSLVSEGKIEGAPHGMENEYFVTILFDRIKTKAENATAPDSKTSFEEYVPEVEEYASEAQELNSLTA